MHIYRVSGEGVAMGAHSVVLAKDRADAIRLHIEAILPQEGSEGDEDKLKQVHSAVVRNKDVVFSINGILVTEFVFYATNGNY